NSVMNQRHAHINSIRHYACNRLVLTMDGLFHAYYRLLLLHLGIGNRDRERLQLLRTTETWLHLCQCVERANHQSGAHQQDQRECNLHNDQSTTCAVLLAALAVRAATFADSSAQARPCVLED